MGRPNPEDGRTAKPKTPEEQEERELEERRAADEESLVTGRAQTASEKVRVTRVNKSQQTKNRLPKFQSDMISEDLDTDIFRL